MSVTRHPLFDDAGRLPNVPADRDVARRLRRNLMPLLEPERRLVERFYERLFASRPDLRALFPPEMASLTCRMRAGLALLVTRLSEPRELALELDKLGRMHAQLGIQAEHYAPARACLIAALAETSGDAWSADLEREWQLALLSLTSAMAAATSAQPPKRT